MISSRARAGIALGIALVVAVLLLAAAGYMLRENESLGDQPADCGEISAGDQLSLLWLAKIRQDDGLPLTNISPGECVSGVRGGVTALVEVGRSELVEDYFTARHACDVQQSCAVSTEAAVLAVRLDFNLDRGWRLTVQGAPTPAPTLG